MLRVGPGAPSGLDVALVPEGHEDLLGRGRDVLDVLEPSKRAPGEASHERHADTPACVSPVCASLRSAKSFASRSSKVSPPTEPGLFRPRPPLPTERRGSTRRTRPWTATATTTAAKGASTSPSNIPHRARVVADREALTQMRPAIPRTRRDNHQSSPDPRNPPVARPCTGSIRPNAAAALTADVPIEPRADLRPASPNPNP